MSTVSLLEHEVAVMGSLIAGGRKAIATVCDILKTEHFTYPLFRLAYSTMLQMDQDGKDYDMGILLAHMPIDGRDRSDLYLAQEHATTTQILRQNAIMILKQWKLRKATEMMEEFIDGRKTLLADIDDNLACLADAINAIVGYGEISEVGSWEEDLANAYKTMHTPVSDRRLRLGLSGCDNILGGIDPTDYVIIAARPSVGKSAFATQAVIHNARQGRRVLFVSLEMPKQQIIERMVAHIGRVALSDIRDRVAAGGPEADVEKERIAEAMSVLRKWSVDIHDKGNITPAGVLRLMRARRYDLVVVDHVGLMSPGIKTTSREQEVSHISRGLRMAAMQTGVQVIALSQLNRAVENRREKKVQLSDLRDSGSLEQDATAVIGLSDAGENRVLLDVLKNRNGRCGEQLLYFDGAHMQFTELEERYEEPRQLSGIRGRQS